MSDIQDHTHQCNAAHAPGAVARARLLFVRDLAGFAGMAGGMFALCGIPCNWHTVGFAAAWGLVGAVQVRQVRS